MMPASRDFGYSPGAGADDGTFMRLPSLPAVAVAQRASPTDIATSATEPRSRRFQRQHFSRQLGARKSAPIPAAAEALDIFSIYFTDTPHSSARPAIFALDDTCHLASATIY